MSEHFNVHAANVLRHVPDKGEEVKHYAGLVFGGSADVRHTLNQPSETPLPRGLVAVVSRLIVGDALYYPREAPDTNTVQRAAQYSHTSPELAKRLQPAEVNPNLEEPLGKIALGMLGVHGTMRPDVSADQLLDAENGMLVTRALQEYRAEFLEPLYGATLRVVS